MFGQLAAHVEPEQVKQRLERIYNCPIWRTAKGEYVPIIRMDEIHLRRSWRALNARLTPRFSSSTRQQASEWLNTVEAEMRRRQMDVPMRALTVWPPEVPRDSIVVVDEETGAPSVESKKDRQRRKRLAAKVKKQTVTRSKRQITMEDV